MTESEIQSDLRARREALDIGRSILLQAPAGSGKTTVLVCRLLKLLAHVDEPEEILAITFTRKAAQEMRARVFEALRAVATGRNADKPEAALAPAALAQSTRRGWDLLRSPARLRIQTIDALNHAIVARLPVLARAGSGLRSGTLPRALYKRVARRALLAALEDPDLAADARLLLARLDNRWSKLEDALADMLARRSHWLPHIVSAEAPDLAGRVEASLQTTLRAELAAAAACLPADLLQEGAELAARSAEELLRSGRGNGQPLWQGVRVPGTEPRDLGCWRALAGLALKKDGQWRKRLTVSQGFPPDQKALKQRAQDWIEALAKLPGADQMLAELAELPEAELAAADRAALQALSRLLLRAAAELQLEFGASGQADFSFVAAAARAALTAAGEPSDFALRFGCAIRHLLVDEFQDTSIEQLQLLRALTAGWSAHDGRTLFVVGDPMQSIYQFREAEVGLFLQLRDHGLGELRFESLQLRRNFRSAPKLVDWVNSRFERLLPCSDEPRLAAIRFLPSVAARDGLALMQLHAMTTDDADTEAARVLDIVNRARASDPAARIAILVASRRHAAPLAAALQGSGIAVRGVKLEPLAERAVVRDLLALTRSLQHPGDRTAWLALLRSPVCGLEFKELQKLFESRTQLPWDILRNEEVLSELSVEAAQRVRRVTVALQPALEGAERQQPVAACVDRCWLRLGGPASCQVSTAQSDAAAFIRALAEVDDIELGTGEQLAEFTADLYASASAANDAVEILTMHAAKGLEWDVVIVPSIGRVTARDAEPLLHWLELPRGDTGTDLLLAPISSASGREPRSLAGYIMRLRRQRSQLERQRLLYVTATRARRELHWLGHAPAGADGPTPRTGSLLHLMWPVIGDEFRAQLQVEPQPPAPMEITAPPPARAASLQRLSAAWRPPTMAPLYVARLPLSLQAFAATPEYSWVGQTARAIGTIVHRELQRLAWQSPPQASMALPAATADNYLQQLAELGVPPGERVAAQQRIRDAIARSLADPRGQWLLSQRHPSASSERRLSGLIDGRVQDISIDRLLVDSQGTRWVIDFKTSTHEGGGVEAFIASELARYEPQLQRYAELACRLGPEPVRAALYFPLLGEFRELAQSGA